MTRVIVDAATVEKLHGLSESLELCDDAGNVFGRFIPDEESPVFRQWLRDLEPGIPEEELRRRAERAQAGGIPADQVLEHLRNRRT